MKKHKKNYLEGYVEQMEKVKVNWCIFFLTFFYLHQVIFKFSILGSYVLIYGIPIIYLMVKEFRKKIVFNKQQIRVIVLLMIMTMMSLLWPTVFGTYDYGNVYIIMLIIKKYIIFTFIFSLLAMVYGERMTIEHFYYYYAMTTVLYVCITLVFIFLPSLKHIWFNLIYISPQNLRVMNNYGYDMRIGWSGFSGFRKTIPCTISILFVMHIQWSKVSTIKMKKTHFVITMIFCLIGNAFYGRIGLAISIMAIFFGLLFYRKIRLGTCIMVIFGAVVIVRLLVMLRNTSLFHDWILWMSTPFINLLYYGNFNNGSVNELHEMLFIPEWRELLFGTGIMAKDYTTGNVLLGNDSGLMRNIIYWGIGGCMVVYTLLYESYKTLKMKDKVFGVLMAGSLIMLEIKGDIYYEFIAMFLACSRIYKVKKICK